MTVPSHSPIILGASPRWPTTVTTSSMLCVATSEAAGVVAWRHKRLYLKILDDFRLIGKKSGPRGTPLGGAGCGTSVARRLRVPKALPQSGGESFYYVSRMTRWPTSGLSDSIRSARAAVRNARQWQEARFAGNPAAFFAIDYRKGGKTAEKRCLVREFPGFFAVLPLFWLVFSGKPYLIIASTLFGRTS
jgi:hypothetical protein